VADHTYEVGDRFEDEDPRSEGRVIEVRELLPDGRYRVQSEVNPKNPSAVGRYTTVSEAHLERFFRKISR
jgi:hypothetical protein